MILNLILIDSDAIITENYVGMKSSSPLSRLPKQQGSKTQMTVSSSSHTAQDAKEEVSENDNDGDGLNQFRKRGSTIRKQLESFHIEDDQLVEQTIELKNDTISCNTFTLEPEAEYEYDGHVDPYDSNAYTTTDNSDVDSRYNSSISDNNDSSSSQNNSSTQGSPSVVEAAVAVKRNVSNNNMTILTRPPLVQEMLSPSHHSNANNSINEMNNILQQTTSSLSTA